MSSTVSFEELLVWMGGRGGGGDSNWLFQSTSILVSSLKNIITTAPRAYARDSVISFVNLSVHRSQWLSSMNLSEMVKKLSLSHKLYFFIYWLHPRISVSVVHAYSYLRLRSKRLSVSHRQRKRGSRIHRPNLILIPSGLVFSLKK